MELKPSNESDIEVFFDDGQRGFYYHNNSLEEVRWNNYQQHNKGSREALDRGMLQGRISTIPKRRRCDSDDDDDDDEEFIEKRILKRRKFEDEMVPKLFEEADPEKMRLFKEWVCSRNTEEEIKLCSYTIPDPMTFFREAYESRMWLDTDHIDLAMLLLRERQVKYPVSFGRFNRAILDSNFHELLKLGTTDVLEGYVEGNVFEHGKKWNGCTHLYYPICTRKHWIAVEVVFSESTMFVYDCDHRVIATSDLEEDLHLASVLIPKLAKLADISMQDTLEIVRIDGLPRQPVPGDCGIYTIKYIEFLSIQESVDEVEDRYMEMWRRKLTVDLFNQNFDP